MPMRPASLLALWLSLSACGGTSALAPQTDAAAGNLAADAAADAPSPVGTGQPEGGAPADTTADQPGAPVPAACALNSECPNPLVCAFGRCHEQCRESRDCSTPGQRCVKTGAGSVCVLPQESACAVSSDCATPLVCAPDLRCRNQCQQPADCAPGQRCAENTCADPGDLGPDGRLPKPGAADGGAADAGAADAGTADAAGMLWGLSQGTNLFRITAVASVNDGCKLDPASVVGAMLPVTIDQASVVSIGNTQGIPPMASLGSGQLSSNRATLVRDNQAEVTPSCTYRRHNVSLLELFAHDQFTLRATEEQSIFSPQCPEIPAGGRCLSSWTWTFVKAN